MARGYQTTTLTPDQYIAGLTDFGPGREKVFSNSADDYLKVHRVGPSDADVTCRAYFASTPRVCWGSGGS